MTPLLQADTAAPPSDSELAAAAGRSLARYVDRPGGVRVSIRADGPAEEVVLPPAAARHLLGILVRLAQGEAVPGVIDSVCSVALSAALLRVSRPHLERLLDDGVIPCRGAGPDRGVRLADLLAYHGELAANRHAALDELASLDQQLGLS